MQSAALDTSHRDGSMAHFCVPAKPLRPRRDGQEANGVGSAHGRAYALDARHAAASCSWSARQRRCKPKGWRRQTRVEPGKPRFCRMARCRPRGFQPLKSRCEFLAWRGGGSAGAGDPRTGGDRTRFHSKRRMATCFSIFGGIAVFSLQAFLIARGGSAGCAASGLRNCAAWAWALHRIERGRPAVGARRRSPGHRRWLPG